MQPQLSRTYGKRRAIKEIKRRVSWVPEPNDWFHVRIVVGADSVRVFVNGATVASLQVAPIVHRAGRKIGYWVGNGSSGDFQHLHLTSTK